MERENLRRPSCSTPTSIGLLASAGAVAASAGGEVEVARERVTGYALPSVWHGIGVGGKGSGIMGRNSEGE